MYPVLFRAGGFHLHTYGVVVMVAVAVGLWIAGREATRKGLPAGAVLDVVIWAVLAGLVGGRLAYVLGWEPELVWDDPAGVFAVWRGGLALHGGLLAGVGVGLWLARRRGLDAWVAADAVAPALALGQGIGRLACLASGDAYGTPTALPWAITFTDPAALAPRGVPLHPTQLYEFALDLGLFGLLWLLRRRLVRDGDLFLVYLGGYGLIRLVTETVRGDRVELGLGLSLLQAVSLVLLAAALTAWGRRRIAAPA